MLPRRRSCAKSIIGLVYLPRFPPTPNFLETPTCREEAENLVYFFLLFSLSSLYRAAVVQVLIGADALSKHHTSRINFHKPNTHENVVPEAREGFRRRPSTFLLWGRMKHSTLYPLINRTSQCILTRDALENPQDPYHPDLAQGAVPREGVL